MKRILQIVIMAVLCLIFAACTAKPGPAAPAEPTLSPTPEAEPSPSLTTESVPSPALFSGDRIAEKLAQKQVVMDRIRECSLEQGYLNEEGKLKENLILRCEVTEQRREDGRWLTVTVWRDWALPRVEELLSDLDYVYLRSGVKELEPGLDWQWGDRAILRAEQDHLTGADGEPWPYASLWTLYLTWEGSDMTFSLDHMDFDETVEVNVDGVWYMVPKLDGFDPVEITPGHFGGTRLYYGDGSIELRNGEEYSLRNRNTREYAYDFPAGRYRWVISLDGETYAAEFTLERDNVA